MSGVLLTATACWSWYAAAASRSKVCPWHRHICLSARVPARRASVSPLAAAAARRSIAYLVAVAKGAKRVMRGWREGGRKRV